MPSFRLVRRTRAAAGASVVAVLATVAAAGSATAATTAPTLQIRSIDTHTKSAPARVLVKTENANVIATRLNRRNADDAFEKGGRGLRVGELTVSDGLRTGKNTLRITATRPNGTAKTVTRTFVVPKRRALADAGDDVTARAGVTTQVGTADGGLLAKGTRTDIHWTVVSKPKGAKVTLRDTDDETVDLSASQPGTYELRMTTDPDGPPPPSSDTVTVAVTPNGDTPLGVPFETLSYRDDGAMRINGQPVPNASDRNNILVAVIERATRAVVESGTVPRHGGGLNQLLGMVDRYGYRDEFLMFVYAYRGVDRDQVDNLDLVSKRLGNPGLSAAEKTAIGNGGAFTIAGIPGGVPGSGWMRVPDSRGGLITSNMTGYLQRNSATEQYDIVSTDRAPFDTKSSTDGTEISVGSKRLPGGLPPGRTAGFHVVALDPMTLGTLVNVSLPIDGQSPGDSERALADTLKDVIERPNRPLVIVQTLGLPTAGSDTWDAVLAQFERLRATRALVAPMAGRNEYAFVGRVGGDRPIAEASSVDERGQRLPAKLSGALTRTRSSGYEPYTASPLDQGSQATLSAITYQEPVAFPAFSGGAKAAQTWIAAQLGFCAASTPDCDLRRKYYENYRSAWGEKSATLKTLAYPGGDPGFTAAEFAGVKTQLVTELSALVSVKTYFEELQKVFPRAGTPGQVNLKKLTDDLYASLQPRPESTSDAYLAGLFNKALPIAQLYLPGEINTGIKSIQSLFALTGYLSTPAGKPVAGAQVKVRSSELATQLGTMIDAAQESIVSQSQLIVSDWGKLRAVASHVDSDWALPASDAKTLQAMNLATNQWIATALFPAAYPDLVHTKWDLRPRDTSCGFDPFLGSYSQKHMWRSLEDSLQVETKNGYTRGHLYSSWRFATSGGRPPKASVGDLLFNDPKDRTPGLGLDKTRFFSAGNWKGRDLYADDGQPYCRLPFSSDTLDWLRP